MRKEVLSEERIILNSLTQTQIIKAIPLDDEVEVYGKSVLVTEMSVEGIITYVNRRFISLTGFSKEELLGSSCNIVKHPDMPEGLFVALWKVIAQKKIWRGYVKNLRKDGKYFWTLMYVQAKLDDNQNIVGYTTSQKVAYKSTIEALEEEYKALKISGDSSYFMRAESYNVDSLIYHEQQLAKKNGLTYAIKKEKI